MQHHIPPPVENAAAQTQTQDLRYIDMGYHDMAGDHPPLYGHRDRAVNSHAGPRPGPGCPTSARVYCPHVSAYTYLTGPLAGD